MLTFLTIRRVLFLYTEKDYTQKKNGFMCIILCLFVSPVNVKGLIEAHRRGCNSKAL